MPSLLGVIVKKYSFKSMVAGTFAVLAMVVMAPVLALPSTWTLVGHYAEAKDSKEMGIYLIAAGAAYVAANSALVAHKQPPLYCQPETFTASPKILG
jgi:hypothetical protein